ncbi:MAG: DUF4382 domain-containing protein [Gammaproteobacteria bacterium]|nr:DUF4382 domain-containing protein [Gammaproteobacteria bacterium]
MSNFSIIEYKRISLSSINKSIVKMLLVCLLAVSLVLVGCSQSDDVSEENASELVIGLTDAKGDFVTYTVDVTSITMVKANGAVVQVLPLTTRVDFAQYTELTEFLTAAMVPHGVYVQAIMSLDYSNADIWVEDDNGDAVKVESIQDVDGNPIVTLDASVRLEGRNKLVISNGSPAHITLDFDLEASNRVVFDTAGIPTQIVAPFLLADVELTKPKPHRLRGPLASVDLDDSSFDIIIRPFRHRHRDDRRFGTLKVVTNDATVYDINNDSYIGAEGLRTMNSLPLLTATVVIGDLKLNPRRFMAREVYAGSSVPGGTLDVVNGTVLARTGNRLTVRGATLIRADGSVIFNDRVNVTVADSTRVKKQLSTKKHDISEISVGQKVSIFGELTDNRIDSTHVDASEGVVRMKVTKLYGTSMVDSALVSPYFMMNLQRINRTRISQFDFTGTGIDAANDADSGNYEVDTGAMDLSDITNNLAVKAFGFVTPFASAPADFVATTLVDLTKLPAVLTLNWKPETTVPFDAMTENSVTLSLRGAALFHHVGRGGAVVDLSTLNIAPVIQANEFSRGLFEIRERASRQLHTSFYNFIDDIEKRLDNGSAMKRIVVTGFFDDATATLTTNAVEVVMVESVVGN